MKKDIRESINKIKSLNEILKIGDNLYDVNKQPNGRIVFAGDNGILGKDNQHISWETLRELMDKYYNK